MVVAAANEISWIESSGLDCVSEIALVAENARATIKEIANALWLLARLFDFIVLNDKLRIMTDRGSSLNLRDPINE